MRALLNYVADRLKATPRCTGLEAVPLPAMLRRPARSQRWPAAGPSRHASPLGPSRRGAARRRSTSPAEAPPLDPPVKTPLHGTSTARRRTVAARPRHGP